jgi:NADH-quinone oxidoreductase subunit E
MIPVDLSLAQRTLARYSKDPRHLISVLQDLQIAYRYLPREALELTSETLEVPLAKVYGVATFYKAFSLVPKGETVLRVCTGTACHIRGAPLILGELEARLGISAGETTEDLSFSLEAVNCVGACALAPVVVANDSAHGNVTVTRARRLVKPKAADNGAVPAAAALTGDERTGDERTGDERTGDEPADDTGRGGR